MRPIRCEPCRGGRHSDCEVTHVGLCRVMCGCECRQDASMIKPSELKRHSRRHWRLVNETGGISISFSERRPGVWPEDEAEKWAEQHPGHQVEVWDQVWYSTPAEWTKVS